MATRNKRKLATLIQENCEEHLRRSLAQNSNVPRSQEDYITQVSEEIEGRVTKKLSQEFGRTENRILGALARLDDFLVNPLIQGHSGTTLETSRNIFSIDQGTNEDDFQSNPLPEAGLFNNQMAQNSGPEDGHALKMRFLNNLIFRTWSRTIQRDALRFWICRMIKIDKISVLELSSVSRSVILNFFSIIVQIRRINTKIKATL